MTKLFPLLIAPVLLPTLASAGVIYSGSTTPSTQGWSLLGAGPYVETPLAQGVQLDTTASSAILAGYFRQFSAGDLNRSTGFRISFTAALPQETTAPNAVRGGFSVLVVTSDTQAIELAFQNSQIFAQNPGFTTFGESVAYSPSPLTTYNLDISGSTYTLLAGDTTLLTGSLRSYAGYPSPFGAVYSTPDLLFLGDDTSQSSARFQLTQATFVPEPTSTLTLLLPAALPLIRRRR